MEYINKATNIEPENEDTLYIKARTLQLIGKNDEALKIYQQLIQKNMNSELYWCSMAALFYNMNQYEEAFDKIMNATKLNGQMFEIWYNFGVLYEKCKQSGEAVVAYTKASEIEPENEIAK